MSILPLLILLAYAAPHRVPDELLASGLSDRNVRVWLAVRKVQGANASAWATTEHYAEVAGKTVGATKNALSELAAEGWIEEVGKRGRTPERRCLVPGSPASETSRSVTNGAANNVTHRDESDPGSVTLRDESPGETSRSVTMNVTHRDESSYKGIRSGNPVFQQQQQQGSAQESHSEKAAPDAAPFPFDEGLARRLIGRGVTSPVAAELVTQVRPGRVLMELERLRRVEALQAVDAPGGLLVRYLRSAEKPLPGWDEAAAVSELAIPSRRAEVAA